MADEQQQQQQQQQLSGQVPYQPRSSGMRLDTLIPRNMASAVQTALDDLEGRVGNLDQFVTQKLNYPSVEEMQGVLAAEQIDGVALAIDNIEHGSGTLIGDQTGVGKGRQAAALLRYAKETDRTPVFITRDANLYADMIRDLEDIGVRGFRPFMTNNNETIPLEDGRELKTSPTSHAAELGRLIQQGGLSPSDDYDGVFTTYSQMQTVRGKNTPRRDFLEQIAPQSIIVMDEAHMAGGSPQNENTRQAKSALPNRAEFARQLVDKADGIVFSSATAIKRPDVMDLYGRRSGMKDALGSVEALQAALEVGGTPLQQVSTNLLAQDGFYTRRERSYAGVEFGIQSVDVDRESTDNLSRIMGGILQFDRAKQEALADLNDHLKAVAKKAGEDNAIGQAGASSTNFTSLMHNVMDQSLLSRKAGKMAEEAIASLEQGEKPILAVSNTMGSFIANYAKDNDLNPGDEVEANFSDILTRYLERSRDVVETDYDGTQTRRRLTDEELGPQAVEAFDRAKELIQETDLSFPVSPIDTIKQKVEAAGYTFGEITGRTARLDYSGNGNPTYERRSSRETSKAAKVEMTDSFNSGRTDVLLLNRSGSTGISLHASEKFTDQRQRHMIVGQAERNVNDFMQTLGRAHRTGQVVPPKISLLMGDTPDEKRPAALLERKMSSLNANTTADKNAGFDTSEIPNFFNQYGDAVVEQILSEYPEINAKLDYPITVSPEGVGSVEEATEGAIAKVTGRLPLLTVKEQEAFYNALESEYTSFVDQQNALGNNVLEAEAVDLDARSLAQAQVIPRKDGVSSAFGSGVSVEIMDVKAQNHAKTQLEVINEVRDNLGLDAVGAVEAHDSEAVDELAQDYAHQLLEKANQAAEVYLAQQSAQARRKTADPEQQQSMINRSTKRLDRQKTQLTQLNRLRLGQTVRLDTGSGRIFYGAVSSIAKRGESLDKTLSKGAQPEASDDADSLGATNPVAPSKWEINVSLADSARELPLPLSKVNTNGMGSVDLTPVKKTLLGKDIMAQFDERQTGQREVRQAFRGNLLRAAEKYGRQGSVINATVSGGGVEPMLMLPQGYDVQRDIQEAPVTLPAARNVRQFMEITGNQGIVKTADERLTLKAAPNDENFLLQTGKKQKDVFLDEGLMETIGDEFYSVSDRMEVMIPADRLEEAAHYIQAGRNQQLEATTHLDQARELVGDKLPEFSWSASVDEVVDQAGLAPAVDLSNLDAVREGLETALQQETDPTEAAEEVSDEIRLENGTAQVQVGVDASGEPLESEPEAARVGGWKAQSGRPEKQVGKLLEEAGLSEAIMADDEFYLKVENQPFIPLSIERQDNRLMLYHTLVENGDAYLDSEMVFNLSEEGSLALAETAVHGPRGEVRGLDRSYANMFAKNLRAQGFAEAAQRQQAYPAEQGKAVASEVADSYESMEIAGDSQAQKDAVEDALMRKGVGNDVDLLDPAAQKVGEVQDAIQGGTNIILTANQFPDGEANRILLNAPDQIRVNENSGQVEIAADELGQFYPVIDFLDQVDDEIEAGQLRQAKRDGRKAESDVFIEPESFDYQHTIESLKATAAGLPESPRESLLTAIQQAETQLAGNDSPRASEPIEAAEVVQAAIAQQDPELNDQMVQGAGTGVPSVEEFRDWYRKASVMGKSEAVLGQIADAGRQAKVGTLPADGYDADAMQADLQGYDHQAAIAADIRANADRFMASAQAAGIVQETATGAIAEGKTYRVTLTDGEMSIHNKQTGGNLAFGEDGITSVQGMTEADRDRWQRLGQKSADELKQQIARTQPRRQPLSRSAQPEPEMA